MTQQENLPIDDLEAVRVISQTLSAFKADDQNRIMRWVQEKLHLNFAPSTNSNQGTLQTPAPASLQLSSPGVSKDIRTFIQEKMPSSDNQFAACVGYFYKFEATAQEKKIAINAADLQEAARKAGRNRLGDPAKTLHNASSQGWLDKRDRGTFEINTVGENLVAMALPKNQTQQGTLPLRQKRKSQKTNSAKHKR